jgi:hypothetical protein
MLANMKAPKLPCLLFFTLFCSTITRGQTRFEKGYFIDSSGKRTRCLILNADWMYSPGSFEYKLDPDGPKLSKTTAGVKEFAIDGIVKYIAANVKMDRSSDDLDDNSMSNSFDPEWREENVFLKVVTEGDATLFSYEEQDFTRYFFRTGSSPVEQLVYKKYRSPGESSFQYNRNYVNQLFAQVNCLQTPSYRMESIAYSAGALSKWFQKHNQCVDPNYKPAISAPKRKLFFPKVFAGISYTSYQSGNSAIAAESNINYGFKPGPTYGVELEFLLPFYNNKWSSFVESSILSYRSAGTNGSGTSISISYNTLNLLFGFRYYSFLNDDLKLFFELGFNKDVKQLKVAPAPGLGVAYSRLMLEYRYFYAKNILSGYFDQSVGGRFDNMFLVVKYTLF